MSQAVNRVWDLGISGRVGIVWLQGGRPIDCYTGQGQPIDHYASIACSKGVDVDSIDYVPKDAECKNLAGSSVFDLLKARGLNPVVMAAQPAPFPEA